MTQKKLLLLCGLTLAVVLLGGCRSIHYSGCGWEVILTGRMSPYCAAMTNGVTGYDLPSPVKKQGFTVDLPNSGGWIVVRNTKTGVGMTRRGDNEDDTYVIMALAVASPDLSTPQAFKKWVDKERAKDTDPKRFTILSNKETLIKDGPQGALCLRYLTKAIDSHARTVTSTSETMHTTNAALACRSPYNSNLVISFVYSHRYHPGNEDKTLPSVFDKLVSTLRFASVTQATKGEQK